MTVEVDPDLVLNSGSDELSTVSFRVPRNSYLILYLPHALEELRPRLRSNITDYYAGWWFEMERTPLCWHFPVGVLYDSLTGLNPARRSSEQHPNTLNVWNLTLKYGNNYPNGIIPITTGIDQIRDFWMHQWKQACYVMNGGSKQMMSLSKRDALGFWDSILQRDLKAFMTVREKIVPSLDFSKSIPLRIHMSLPRIGLLEPIAKVRHERGLTSLDDILIREFPEWFSIEPPLAKPVIQGIDVPLEASLWDLYLNLSSFDGFLDVSVCLLDADQSN